MISIAKIGHRSASLVNLGLTALLAGSLLAACTDTPKIEKADNQPRSSNDQPAGRPAPEPQSEAAPQPEPAKPAAPKPEVAPPTTRDSEEAPAPEKAPAPETTPPQEDRETRSYHDEKSARPPSDFAGKGRGLEEEEPPEAVAPPPPAADPNKKYTVVPVYYGTDRAIEPDNNRLQFGSDRGHKLILGRALITVPAAHKVPQIERPLEIEIPIVNWKIYTQKEDPEKHFTVEDISALTEGQLLALVKERLKASKIFKDHAFIFVHGFNTTFDNALYRTAQISYDLGFDGAPFVYSWPSRGSVMSYTYDRASVEQAEPMLTDFVDMVIQKSGAKSISFIAHSMGNELLLRVLERLRPKIPPGVVISQVIFAAPDVDRDKFNNIAREIKNFAKGVTLYAASNDRALAYSQTFWGGVPRAGDIPKSGPLIIPGVDTIDVSAVSMDAFGLNHSGYAENQSLLDDVKALVKLGIRPPNKRLKEIVTVDSPEGTYWRFQTGN